MLEFNPCHECAYEKVHEHKVCLDCTRGDKFQVPTCDLCKHFNECETDIDLEREINCIKGSKFELYVLPKPKQNDVVNHPSHYNAGKFETIDIIQDTLSQEEFKGFLVGNAIKYISRARYKGGQTDIDKCIWYLKKWIEVVKREGKV